MQLVVTVPGAVKDDYAALPAWRKKVKGGGGVVNGNIKLKLFKGGAVESWWGVLPLRQTTLSRKFTSIFI